MDNEIEEEEVFHLPEEDMQELAAWARSSGMSIDDLYRSIAFMQEINRVTARRRAIEAEGSNDG